MPCKNYMRGFWMVTQFFVRFFFKRLKFLVQSRLELDSNSNTWSQLSSLGLENSNTWSQLTFAPSSEMITRLRRDRSSSTVASFLSSIARIWSIRFSTYNCKIQITRYLSTFACIWSIRFSMYNCKIQITSLSCPASLVSGRFVSQPTIVQSKLQVFLSTMACIWSIRLVNLQL